MDIVAALTQKRRDDQKKFHNVSEAIAKLQQQGSRRNTAEEKYSHDVKQSVEGRTRNLDLKITSAEMVPHNS